MEKIKVKDLIAQLQELDPEQELISNVRIKNVASVVDLNKFRLSVTLEKEIKDNKTLEELFTDEELTECVNSFNDQDWETDFEKYVNDWFEDTLSDLRYEYVTLKLVKND